MPDEPGQPDEKPEVLPDTEFDDNFEDDLVIPLEPPRNGW